MDTNASSWIHRCLLKQGLLKHKDLSCLSQCKAPGEDVFLEMDHIYDSEQSQRKPSEKGYRGCCAAIATATCVCVVKCNAVDPK